MPDRVLRAIDTPVIDYRIAALAGIGKAALSGSRKISRTLGFVALSRHRTEVANIACAGTLMRFSVRQPDIATHVDRSPETNPQKRAD